MPAEVGGRGDGNMAVGVAIELFWGVEPECGLAPLGVAIVYGWCQGSSCFREISRSFTQASWLISVYWLFPVDKINLARASDVCL